jgi:hypothetical protein
MWLFADVCLVTLVYVSHHCVEEIKKITAGLWTFMCPRRRSIFFIRTVGGGTGSTRHVGHWMAYCTCPGWLWWWRILWNKDWQGKAKYSEKTGPSVTLSTTNPTCQTRAQTRAAAVGSQRLIAWAMARPYGDALRQLLYSGIPNHVGR